MAAVLLTGHGGFDKLEYREDVPVPQPKMGEVLIRVLAAGVNNTDINTRTAWYSKTNEGTTQGGGKATSATAAVDATWGGEALQFPRIQGIDVCGRIVAVGSGVNSSQMGERVLVDPCLREPVQWESFQAHFLGSECNGGFAQYCVAPAIHTHKIECPLTDAELASFPCAYSTAENLLHRMKLAAGETVLVTGASGGVGSAAVQLAKRRGAKVIAVAAEEKGASVVALGAERVVPRGENLVEALGRECLEAVVDLVAGPQWPELFDLLKPGGRYATAGAIAGPIVPLDVRTLYLKDLSFFGCTVLDREVFPNLIRYIERGEVQPVVAATFPLSEIVKAQQLFLSKKFTGKLVLLPPS
ncbi:MAG TPA: alcohol dehydrogenase [Deltaproteobacteria bacterium]|nr:alcohol dehydrogenase [Deltaproteobacteria bacterium]